MALGRQVVNLIGPDLLENPNQVGGIGQISVMEDHFPIFFMGILIEMVNAVCIEQRGPALDTVHLIALGKQKFSKIGPVLAGDAGNECFFCHISPLWSGGGGGRV